MEHSSLASFLAAHGYWLIAAGCVLEGETVMVVAGFAARRGCGN
jgi:membrane protein DedA with SNARE-associated domain